MAEQARAGIAGHAGTCCAAHLPWQAAALAARLAGCADSAATAWRFLGTDTEPSATGTCSAAATASGWQTMDGRLRRRTPPCASSAIDLAWGEPYYTKLSLATARPPAPDVGDHPHDPAAARSRRRASWRDRPTAWLAERHHGRQLAPAVGRRPRRRQGLRGAARHPPSSCTTTPNLREGRACSTARQAQADGRARTPSSMRCAKAKKVDGHDRRRRRRSRNETVDAVAVSSSRCTASSVADARRRSGTKVVIDDDQGAAGARPSCASCARAGCPRRGARLPGRGRHVRRRRGRRSVPGRVGDRDLPDGQDAVLMTLFPNVFGGRHYAVQADSHTLVVPKQPDRRPGPPKRSLRRSSTRCSTRARPGPRAATSRPGCRSGTARTYKKLTPQSQLRDGRRRRHLRPATAGTPAPAPTSRSSSAQPSAPCVAGQLTPEAALDQMHSKLDSLADTASPL